MFFQSQRHLPRTWLVFPHSTHIRWALLHSPHIRWEHPQRSRSVEVRCSRLTSICTHIFQMFQIKVIVIVRTHMIHHLHHPSNLYPIMLPLGIVTTLMLVIIMLHLLSKICHRLQGSTQHVCPHLPLELRRDRSLCLLVWIYCSLPMIPCRTLFQVICIRYMLISVTMAYLPTG